MTIASQRERLSGWGRYPVLDCASATPSDTAAVCRALDGATNLIPRGNGRSYGDSSLNADLTLDMRKLDRMLAFDETSGLLTCEGGVLLPDIIGAFLPRGWFVQATPGTRFVTVGGMIAADVHGKNHHGAGSFCDHLEWLDIAVSADQVLRCSRSEHGDLFAATCGGMGLTGVILRAAFHLNRIETATFRQRTSHARNLDEAISQLEAGLSWSYAVAWTDCLAKGASLGRSVVFLAEPARYDELPANLRDDPFARLKRPELPVPIDFPGFALSNLSVRVFNETVYRAQRGGETLVNLEKYFYPLDSIRHWNRIYGRRGFLQYQCVLPHAESAEGLRRLLTTIAAAGDASFLTVLKLMGSESFGLLSFPCPGFTLALDFPIRPDSFALLDRLDAITMEHGGRLYLCKDARMSPGMAAAGYPRLETFREVRRRYGLTERFQSEQSRRLEL